MEKNLCQIEPLEDFDIEVQRCDPDDCLYDCPLYAPGKCNYMITKDF